MEFEAFKNKIWLATPTKHDEELKYIQEALLVLIKIKLFLI